MADAEYLTITHLDRKAIARIFSKISINRKTGCWEWTGPVSQGYGKIWLRLDGRNTKDFVHRILFAWTLGPIPRGRCRTIPILDHATCDNRRCCNPCHLELTSHRRNVLRGECPSAQNYRKEFCNRWHELPNIPNRSNGKRQCEKCSRLYVRPPEEMARRSAAAKRRYHSKKSQETPEHRAHRLAVQRAYRQSDTGRATQAARLAANIDYIRAYQRDWARRRRGSH